MKSSNKIVFALLTFVFIFSCPLVFGQDPEATVSAVRDKPMYEKFGMTPTQLFALMVSFTLLLVGFVFSLAASVASPAVLMERWALLTAVVSV